MFQLEQLSDEEFDQKLELAEDMMNEQKQWRNNHASVWLNELKEGFSLASVFTSGKPEQFAAARAVSRLIEMQSEEYWIK